MLCHRITPDFVSTLQENGIFVFGCRNSGRHSDGASAFALKHFGAVFGQWEGAQGQSYAIPTIGGTIGLKAIGESVMRFTKYAAAHPELRFLVTAIGCGGGRLASVTDCPDVPQGGIAAECMASTGSLGFPLCVIDQEEILFLWVKQ